MEVDSGRDFAAEKPQPYSPEKHEKKKKRKKREIQLTNGAEAVTDDDLTATAVVEEAPLPSSGGDKKSRKQKKREIQLANGAKAVTGDDLTATDAVNEAPSGGDKKSSNRKKGEIQLANGAKVVTGDDLTATTDAVKEAPSRGDKKGRKQKKGEIQLANGAKAVTGDDLTTIDAVKEAPSGGDKKSRKQKKGEIQLANGAKALTGDDLTATNVVGEAPSGGDKKSRNQKKREIQLANGAKAVTGDDLTATDVVEEAPSSSKSGGDKKSRKRKKEADVPTDKENGSAKISGEDDSTTMKPGPKNKRNKEKDVGVGGSGRLGENGTAEMGGSGKEGDSDDSATSKPRPKKKRNKGKDVAVVSTETEMSNASKIGASDDSQNANPRMKKPSKPSKRVSFSGEVEVFDDKGKRFRPEENDDALVRGERFTPEEDDMIKEAVMKYIEGNQLGKEGLQMVLNNMKHPHLRGCWKVIGASLPRRPFMAVYFRAHVLFERGEARKWQPHEYETLTRLHEQFGPDWKIIGAELGKHRIHVKDTWRRIRLANRNYGNWSQEEYQSLFDLVNLDLAMKAFDEKKTKHGMLRDNISWEAISTKLSTREHSSCCNKWYKQLSSPLVSQGLWLDTDDYRLLDALQKLDACCIDDVDWDNLIKYRPGDICRKRWEQMARHIGGHREKTFIEQLDVLSKRYCPEMLQYRKDEGCSNATPRVVHRPTKKQDKMNK